MFGPQQLAEEVRFILSRSPTSPGLPIIVDLIANPAAGGFTRPAYAKRRSAELATLRLLAETLPARETASRVGLHPTGRAGHATEIARGIIAEARAKGYPPALRIIMTAGGDGTSLESVSALMELSQEERANWLVLRLPLGTGNDGSEGRDLGVALGRFLGPCGVGSRSAIRAIPNPKGGREALWSFNIASVGVDAFVGDLTNRFKTSFPGDSYKVMLDLAAVIYDLIWPSFPMRILVTGPEGERVIDGDCLLLAFGASGNRQYGSNKKILPGPENSCLVPRMSLWGKLKIKGPLSDGGHAAFPKVKLFNASRLVIEYPVPLLFQVDGEVYRFEPADFPLELKLVPDAYCVIEPASK